MYSKGKEREGPLQFGGGNYTKHTDLCRKVGGGSGGYISHSLPLPPSPPHSPRPGLVSWLSGPVRTYQRLFSFLLTLEAVVKTTPNSSSFFSYVSFIN